MRILKSTLLVTGSIICILSVPSPAVLGQDSQSPLTSRLDEYFVVANDEGEEELIKGGEANPGQVIEYVFTYTNSSNQPLTGVKLVGPVPNGTEYIGRSAKLSQAAVFEASIDQGNAYHPEPVPYVKTLPDGTSATTEATPDMYTHLRWQLSTMNSKSSVIFRYRVRVK